MGAEAGKGGVGSRVVGGGVGSRVVGGEVGSRVEEGGVEIGNFSVLLPSQESFHSALSL